MSVASVESDPPATSRKGPAPFPLLDAEPQSDQVEVPLGELTFNAASRKKRKAHPAGTSQNSKKRVSFGDGSAQASDELGRSTSIPNTPPIFRTQTLRNSLPVDEPMRGLRQTDLMGARYVAVSTNSPKLTTKRKLPTPSQGRTRRRRYRYIRQSTIDPHRAIRPGIPMHVSEAGSVDSRGPQVDRRYFGPTWPAQTAHSASMARLAERCK